ncbi:MAG TPA: hypothetical protein VFK88_07265 [Gallionella sp.]|nr:hypothetical protein [Gallionella sp.]
MPGKHRAPLLVPLPRLAAPVRHLAPFVLLSLLMHAALLWLVRLPVAQRSIARPHPLSVYFVSPAAPASIPVSTRVRPATKVPSRSAAATAKLVPLPDTPDIPPPVQPQAASPSGSPPSFDTQEFRESVRDIARDEARKIERQIAAQEKQRANSPAGMLAQQLRLTGKEIRLANGMLKLETAAGVVCFQPVPSYARDTPGLYGIPMTCP